MTINNQDARQRFAAIKAEVAKVKPDPNTGTGWRKPAEAERFAARVKGAK